MSDTMRTLHASLSNHLCEIETYFKPKVELAVIVRVPGNDEADVFTGNISPAEAIALIKRRATAAGEPVAAAVNNFVELAERVERYKNPPLPDWADGYESEAGPLTNAVEFLAMCADLADKERECQSLRDALARIEPPLPEGE